MGYKKYIYNWNLSENNKDGFDYYFLFNKDFANYVNNDVIIIIKKVIDISYNL